MARNRGKTTLKCKHSSINPMRDYDKLPAELREWVATANLPWRAQSVQRAYEKALARTGNRRTALRELDALQARLVAKDALRIWGAEHPDAQAV